MTCLSQGSFERAKFSCGEWFLCAKVYIKPDHAGPVSAGDRRNLYGVTEARLLLWLSRIHQREGQRGVENLLCVYRREQTAEYGAELRPAQTGAERFLCADIVAVEPRWTRFITSAEWRRLLLPIPSLCVYDLHWSLLSSLVFEAHSCQIPLVLRPLLKEWNYVWSLTPNASRFLFERGWTHNSELPETSFTGDPELIFCTSDVFMYGNYSSFTVWQCCKTWTYCTLNYCFLRCFRTKCFYKLIQFCSCMGGYLKFQIYPLHLKQILWELYRCHTLVLLQLGKHHAVDGCCSCWECFSSSNSSDIALHRCLILSCLLYNCGNIMYWLREFDFGFCTITQCNKCRFSFNWSRSVYLKKKKFIKRMLYKCHKFFF